MSDLINEIARKVYNTRVCRKPKASYIAGAKVVDEKIVVEHLDVKLIVMSRDTFYEVCRLDYNGHTGLTMRQDKSEPYRMFDIRVAFDDSLSLGNVLVAGEVA